MSESSDKSSQKAFTKLRLTFWLRLIFTLITANHNRMESNQPTNIRRLIRLNRKLIHRVNCQNYTEIVTNSLLFIEQLKLQTAFDVNPNALPSDETTFAFLFLRHSLIARFRYFAESFRLCSRGKQAKLVIKDRIQSLTT